MVPSPCKAFLPLESNPTVFNELIQLLGVSPRLAFEDIFSLDDNPDLLLSRPALALILVFPADDVLEADALSDRPAYAGFGSEEPVLWFRQTIQNACGLYAVLHAVCNGAARGYIGEPHLPFRQGVVGWNADERMAETDGPLAGLLERAVPLSPADRAKVLEDSAELEGAHAAVAVKGDSAVPGSAEEEVEFHYVAFVGGQDGRVWELDGDQKGPVETGVGLGDGGDVCCQGVLDIVRGYVDGAGGNVNFGLMALVERGEGEGGGVGG